MKSQKIILLALALLCSTAIFAQNTINAKLLDSSNGDAISFATVSLTLDGATKPAKYVLSAEDGSVNFSGVRKGTYTFKAELLGYKALTKEIKVVAGENNLGELKMDPDNEMLEAAKVSTAGNPIIIKKDTIEYNASSFKTTDNDVLEDLLKKLPGIEVSEDGSITANGETISKITIDGKTFFLDDPQLASKNIPAKIVHKLKVIEKKSEQAEFTGIDDGEEETVIDLSIKPGMMKGMFGNVQAGVGHDIPADDGVDGDWRYQGAAFLGKFTDDTQLSLILNGNNTNNRGFNDLAGSMMGNMRSGGMGGGQGGWGGGNGITTSYMGGVNGAWTLFDDRMDLSANYLYDNTDKDVREESVKTTYFDDYNLTYNSEGASDTKSYGHRFGVRLDHKFSDNTSILFEPQVNFGGGSYNQVSQYETYTDDLSGADASLTNSGNSIQTGDNKNVSTSGFGLLRQRLGIPGRTLTVMGRYSFSNNDLDAANYSNTYIASTDSSSVIDQHILSNQKSTSLMGRVTYTEPLGNGFYVEGNYAYNWKKSSSEKNTTDNITGLKDYTYSNEIVNESSTQEIGANLMYQKSKSRLQVGFAAMPTNTYNSTTRYNTLTDSYDPTEYKDFRWNFSPRMMLWWEFNENLSSRLFYRGTSSQPSTSQLMPVPDNTDPLNVSFGNPSLDPYFSHNIRGDVRYNNKQNFTSLNVHFNAGLVQNPIVSAIWYDTTGAQYVMPFNGPNSGNFGIDGFLNMPIAKSNFSLSNMTRFSWSKASSYIGNDIDMSRYTDDGDYYGFMEDLIEAAEDEDYFSEHFETNTIKNISLTERLRLTYRLDNLELTASGRTRMNKSDYTIATATNTTTWNNQIRLTANWTWEQTGITLKSEGNYNWYRGYTVQQDDEFVLNAEIQKLLFKDRVTFAIKGYDILGQAKNLTVTDASNYHKEALNNTLGRYIIASLTFRFGTFDRSKMRGPGGPGGPGGRPGLPPGR